MSLERLREQIRFIIEIDRLKGVIRQSYLIDGSRLENSAEHSWHLAMLAIVLAEHANEPVDLTRVIKMVLVHDIVEIDAGDVFCYDEAGNLHKAEREQLAAERLFGLLPADQAQEMHELWNEFEARETAEARFANAVDRLMPLLHNYHTEGKAWQFHGITSDRVLARNSPIGEGARPLWQYAENIIADAVARGYLAEGPAVEKSER